MGECVFSHVAVLSPLPVLVMVDSLTKPAHAHGV